MTEPTGPVYPPIVQEALDELAGVGLVPRVEQKSRWWRITVTSDRVACVLVYRRSPAGRFTWESTLTIDGADRPLVEDARQLAEVIRDPDSFTAAVPVRPMPPAASVAGAPPRVQQTYRLLVKNLGVDAVALGRDGRDWVLGLESPAVSLRVQFGRVRGTRYGLGPIRLVIDGIDYSEQVGSDLSAALRLLGTATRPAESPGTAGAPNTTGERSNAVEIRRATVIRN